MITVTVSRSLTLTPAQWSAIVGGVPPNDVAGFLWQHHPVEVLAAVLHDGTTEADDWHVYVHPAADVDDAD